MAIHHSSQTALATQAETRVWQAVLLQTIEEWQYGPLRLKRKAEDYLFNNNVDFPEVCSRAGMNAATLRAKLTKLRR